MEKIKNLSLKCSIILYMTIALIVSTLISFAASSYAETLQDNIWYKYLNKEEYRQSINRENGRNFLTDIPRVSSKYMNNLDVLIVEQCDFIISYSNIILSFAGCTIAIFTFYKNKLKVPLEILSVASKKISNNDLEFQLNYNVKDEMGELCKEFEKMKSELVADKKKMWCMMEDEKILHSVIAHDIRTPITIVKGNLEIIEEFLPLGQLTDEKTLEIVQRAMTHMTHLEYFLSIMKKYNSITEIEPKYQKLSYHGLLIKIKEIQEVLCKKNNLQHDLYGKEVDDTVSVDPMIITEVVENLISNSLRYAKSKIDIFLEIREKQLILMVVDDGPGFKESPQKLTQAYFKSKEDGGEVHYGLGLYISKVLCSIHGGKLTLENGKSGGANATASFWTNNDNNNDIL